MSSPSLLAALPNLPPLVCPAEPSAWPTAPPSRLRAALRPTLGAQQAGACAQTSLSAPPPASPERLRLPALTAPPSRLLTQRARKPPRPLPCRLPRRSQLRPLVCPAEPSALLTAPPYRLRAALHSTPVP